MDDQIMRLIAVGVLASVKCRPPASNTMRCGVAGQLPRRTMFGKPPSPRFRSTVGAVPVHKAMSKTS